MSAPPPPTIVSAPVPPVMVSRVGTAGDREGFGLTRQGDRDASPGRRREIASTPWIDALERRCVRSDDVDVRLIMSPVPEPRLMVPSRSRLHRD